MRVSLTMAAAVLSMMAPMPSARAEVVGRYVALGDSFVAGPFIPRQHGASRGCLRSDRNYPSLIAERLRTVVLVDVSCSGARTSDLLSPQKVRFGWQTPAQLDALTPATTLVTLGIGGDDIGYTNIAISCGTMGLLNPAGAPCAKRFGRELGRRISATGPKVAAVLRIIRQRAPRARVLVVGYPRLLPAGAGCWPLIPLGAADTVYLDGVERDLNWMLRTEAAAGGAEFVDTYAGGDGHDMCANSRQKWVEGVVPTSAAAPLHPNARGMEMVAARVLAVLGRGRLFAAPAPAPAPASSQVSVAMTSGTGSVPAVPAKFRARPVVFDFRPVPIRTRPVPVRVRPLLSDFRPAPVRVRPVLSDFRPAPIRARPVVFDFRPVPVRVRPVPVAVGR